MSTLDSEPGPDEPSSLLVRIKRRKLFQWAIAYAGGAWLILQLLSLLAQPFPFGFGASQKVRRQARQRYRCTPFESFP